MISSALKACRKMQYFLPSPSELTQPRSLTQYASDFSIMFGTWHGYLLHHRLTWARSRAQVQGDAHVVSKQFFPQFYRFGGAVGCCLHGVTLGIVGVRDSAGKSSAMGCSPPRLDLADLCRYVRGWATIVSLSIRNAVPMPMTPVVLQVEEPCAALLANVG